MRVGWREELAAEEADARARRRDDRRRGKLYVGDAAREAEERVAPVHPERHLGQDALARR